MEQDDNLIGRTSSTIVISETEVQKDDSYKKLNLFSRDVLENAKISQPNQSSVQPKQVEQTKQQTPSQGLEKIKEHIKMSQYTTYVPETKQENKDEVVEEQSIEEDYQNEQIESLYSTSLSIESTSDEQLQEELGSYSKKDSKSYKFRFRLATGVFCCLLALLGGWIIGNVIQIASTNTEIAKATEYSVDLKDLIKNISRTDQEQTPAKPSDGTLLPIEEVIPITPLPVEEPTEYEEESNWFDKICNWLNNIFGG